MNRPFGTIILKTFCRYITPFILLYGIYVLIHGEFSPGGGFQAGAVLAFAVILGRLVQGDGARVNMSGNLGILTAAGGGLIFAAVGLMSIPFGGHLFNYGVYPLNMPADEMHPLGILGIEVGVTLCVMGVIIAIFDALTRKDELL
ncbi:MAG: hypothetical protein GX318_01430 [Clostridia bacterium]|nr:hypothetical protein [Clostridia bacterium]